MAVRTLSIEERIAHKIKEIDAVAEDLPGVIIIHNVKTTMVEYMSPRGLRLLKITLPKLQAMGIEYHTKYFNVEESKEYVPKIFDLVKRNKEEEWVTFFQQVRIELEHRWKWHCTSVKILMKDDEGKPLLTVSLALPIDPADNLSIKADRLLYENNFLRKHYHDFDKLTKREKIALAHLALGKTAGEVAQAMNIATQTVDSYRKSIKQKLDIKTTYEMAEYARAFDLI